MFTRIPLLILVTSSENIVERNLTPNRCKELFQRKGGRGKQLCTWSLHGREGDSGSGHGQNQEYKQNVVGQRLLIK